MRQSITTELIRRLPPGPCDIRDTKQRGFVVRVRANGTASYLVQRGRGWWHTIGSTDVLTPVQARTEARGLLGADAKARSNGLDPRAQATATVKATTQRTLTLRAFLDQHLEPFKLQHEKRGAETLSRLRAVFADLLDLPLSELTAWRFQKWRTERLARRPRPKPATVNSHRTMLLAALAKAVEWEVLGTNPLAGVKPLTADKTGRIRYLSPAEESRLRGALDARDQARRARREQSNAWRVARGYAPWPTYEPHHLTAIVLLALNTGLRKGELFNLRWSDVDLSRAQLTVRGEGAKTMQTRYLPLNAEAVTTLQDWRAATDHEGYVFAGDEGGRLEDVKKAWLPVVKAAKLTGFRFHDLRHSFASKLVMAGVDLNTVRELLGHSDIQMTLRYAHLAPEHKAAAVALVARTR